MYDLNKYFFQLVLIKILQVWELGRQNLNIVTTMSVLNEKDKVIWTPTLISPSFFTPSVMWPTSSHFCHHEITSIIVSWNHETTSNFSFLKCFSQIFFCKIFYLHYFLSMSVLPEYMYVHHVCGWCLWRSEEDTISLCTRVTTECVPLSQFSERVASALCWVIFLVHFVMHSFKAGGQVANVNSQTYNASYKNWPSVGKRLQRKVIIDIC